MTLTEANLIWTDCYASTDLTLWAKYSDRQRREAIEVRDQAANGQWGIWNISDRH